MDTPFLQVRNTVFPDIPLTVFYVGMVKDKNPCPPHWHNTVEILLFRDDTDPTRCLCEDNNVEATAGDLLIFTPDQVHSLQLQGHYGSHDCLQIQRRFLEEFGLPTANLHFHMPIHDENIARSFLRIRDLFNSYNATRKSGENLSNRKLAIKAETLSLYARLVDEYSAPVQKFLAEHPQDKYDLISQVVKYIQQNLTAPITLADISQHVQFSQSYLCHKIRELTGYTAMDLVNILRCQHARVLLHEEKCSINECARRSGFSSTSYMAKIYRRYYHESPSDTRRMAQRKTKQDP